jgi:hypothetical protein
MGWMPALHYNNNSLLQCHTVLLVGVFWSNFEILPDQTYIEIIIIVELESFSLTMFATDLHTVCMAPNPPSLVLRRMIREVFNGLWQCC